VCAGVALAIAYFVIVRRLTRKMQETVGEMEAMLVNTIDADGFHEVADEYDFDLVPPMQIRLGASQRELFRETELCRRIDAWLLDHGFQRIACFIIDELEEEELCVYLSDDRKLVGAIRQRSDESEPFVEFCFDLSDGGHTGLRGGVSNPPGGTLQLPADAVGQHFAGRLSDNFELLSQMWLVAKELVDARRVQEVDPSQIAEFYEEAHAAEMESRIRVGGVSTSEVRESFQSQGIAATDDDVEAVVDQWQTAIADHLIGYSRKAENQFDDGRDVLVVYETISTKFLLSSVREFFAALEGMDTAEVELLIEELQQLLRRFSPRDAIARFRPLLPPEMRYSLIDQIREPV
jgi:hypothetical protein